MTATPHADRLARMTDAELIEAAGHTADDALIASLRDCKQRVFNEMVEGNGRPPAEVVEVVTWALGEVFPDLARRLYAEVVNFHPDYTG